MPAMAVDITGHGRSALPTGMARAAFPRGEMEKAGPEARPTAKSAPCEPYQLLFFHAKRVHPIVVRAHIDSPVREREAAVVIPTVDGSAARIEGIAGRGIEDVEHGLGRLVAAGETLARA